VNHVELQRRFYDTRAHAHLQAREDDAYARKLVDEVARTLGMRPGCHVLEAGSGFGRFTFALLDMCDSVLALDLSSQALGKLVQVRDSRGIPPARCQTCCADLMRLDPRTVPAGSCDFVVGFFLLHHLERFEGAIGRLVRLLRPGGRIAFVEPNRWNPLFAWQIAACSDMKWREEKGMFRLTRERVENAYRRANLSRIETRAFGFFPPQIFNRFAAARSFERRIERLHALRGVLPFLLLSAEAPTGEELPR